MTQSNTTTKTRSPEEIITELAPAYHEWKGGEKSKNQLKTEFFDAITEYLSESGEQADMLVTVRAQDAESAIENAEKLNPAWVAVDQREGEGENDGFWEIILEERPEYQAFTIEHDGHVWGRQVADGGTLLDDERLQVEDPELWTAVTEYPHQKLVEDVAYESGTDPSEKEFTRVGFQEGFDGYIEWQCERHGLKRSLKSTDEIEDELLAKLKEYMYPGPPTIKLPAPKKVKE